MIKEKFKLNQPKYIKLEIETNHYLFFFAYRDSSVLHFFVFFFSLTESIFIYLIYFYICKKASSADENKLTFILFKIFDYYEKMIIL